MPSPRQRERELIAEFGRRGANGFVPPTRAEQPAFEPATRERGLLLERRRRDERWYVPTYSASTSTASTDSTATWTTVTTLPEASWRRGGWFDEQIDFDRIPEPTPSERVLTAQALQRLSSAIDERILRSMHEQAFIPEVTSPSASDAVALGTSTLHWDDLHLASGAVVNWENGRDVTSDLRILRPGTCDSDINAIAPVTVPLNFRRSSPYAASPSYAVTLERDGKKVTQALNMFDYVTFDEMEALCLSAENMTYDQGVTIDHDGERYVFKKEA